MTEVVGPAIVEPGAPDAKAAASKPFCDQLPTGHAAQPCAKPDSPAAPVSHAAGDLPIGSLRFK